MNIVVIAPHPDDEAIGCGGAICLHSARGDRVVAVFLTSGELGLQHLPREHAWRVREREAQRAAKVMGLAELVFLRQEDWFVGDEVEKAAACLGPVLQQERPEIVYLPHANEWHPDHRAALAVVQAALPGRSAIDTTLRTYEVWTPLSDYDHVEDITTVMAQKLRAIRCYRSQRGAFAYDRAVLGLNQYRGALAGGCRYSEVFREVGGSEEED